MACGCCIRALRRVIAQPGRYWFRYDKKNPRSYGTVSQATLYVQPVHHSISPQGQGLPINSPHYPPANKQTSSALWDNKCFVLFFVRLMFFQSDQRIGDSLLLTSRPQSGLDCSLGSLHTAHLSLKHYDHSPAAALLCPHLLLLNAKGTGKTFRVDTGEGVLGGITAEEYLTLKMRAELF